MLTVNSHIAYLVVSILLTVWVARTLHRHGRVFLVDTFDGNESFADSVNSLLVVGFYLINAGYITLALRSGTDIQTTAQLIEYTAGSLGRVLLVLGGMHFFNLYVFTRMRRRALVRQAPPPVAPSQRIQAVSP